MRTIDDRAGGTSRDAHDHDLQRGRPGDPGRGAFELAADVEAGDSGGGLVTADGHLVGIVWATSRGRADRASAMPIEAIDPLLTAAEEGHHAPAVRCAR